MNENTTQLLEKLADKLGTTSEYLWGVLLSQAPVDAIITTIQIALIAVATMAYSKLLSRHIKSADDYSSGDDVYFAKSIIFGITGVLLIFFVFAAFFAIDNVINGFFNPEYWALNQILEILNQ